MGLRRAGFDVVGFDIEPQPHYPFEFHQQDALIVDLSGFDFVWSSPPCQAYSMYSRNLGTASSFPDLIAPVREKLQASGLPWVIENVPGAPLRGDVLLCGTMFGLPLLRHRYFELSWQHPLDLLQCRHTGQEI